MSNGATAGTALDRDIVELLKTCPSVWTDVDFDRQSSLRETSLAHLVGAGLIEARHTWRWTFQPPSAAENADTETEEVEFVIDVRGEGWMNRLREMWPRICPPHWFDGTTAKGHYAASITAVKLRLSDQGESATHDLEAGDEFQVVDFVLRRNGYADRLPTKLWVNVVSSVRKPNSVGWPKREAEHTADGIAEALPVMPSDATGQGDAVSDDTTPPKPEHEFRPNGDGYDITFYESGHVSAFRCKGLHQIHRLIETPMVPVLMTELEGARLDDPHSRQDVADQDTLRDVAGKLREAKSELDRATASQNHDTIDVEHCRQEVEKWEDELGKLLGLRGQVRDLNNPYDKKRPKIWGTINTAKKRLREFGHSELADHLDGSIDSERAWFVYVPKLNPIPNWKTEKKDASLRP